MNQKILRISLLCALLALAASNVINIGILRNHIRAGDEIIAADRRLKAANDHLMRASEELERRSRELMLANERLRSACNIALDGRGTALYFRP